MAGLEAPSAPELGTVKHFSVELCWEAALKKAKETSADKTPIRVHLQSKADSVGHRGDWITCYRGMAKKYVVSDLTPKSKYHFRFQLEKKEQVSAWSPSTIVTTAREPLYAENLHMAIRKRSLPEMEEVLKSGEVSPDVPNEDGVTALMVAAKKSFLEAMDLLIQYGADVNCANQDGKTALMIACTLGILESVKMLREHDADYHLYDRGGSTAIHWAVDSRNAKLVEWIAKDNADVNIKDRGQGEWTPLIRCATRSGDRDVALALMMNGADIHMTDKNGSTALHHAVMCRHYELTKVLLQRRSDPLLPNKEKNTAWMIACSSDDRRSIMTLMQKYVDEINTRRKSAALQDAKANTLQITSSLKNSSTSVISPVQ